MFYNVAGAQAVTAKQRPGGGEAASWPNIPAAPAPDVARAKPAPGRAGSLQQVRVGSHPNFTRLVFELDAKDHIVWDYRNPFSEGVQEEDGWVPPGAEENPS